MDIIKTSINRRVTVLMAVMIVIVLGVVSFSGIPIDLLPEIDLATMIVYTSYTGVGPKEMETLVTRPLEEGIASTSNLKEISSTSSRGISMITLSFVSGTDMDYASLEVREKIDLVKGMLPDDVSSPMLFKLSTDMMPVAVLSVSDTSGSGDLAKLKSLAEDKVKPAIERVGGVASASIIGGVTDEVTVYVDPASLAGYGLSIASIREALARENFAYPAGEVNQGKTKMSIRITAEFNDLEEIRNLPITLRTGETIQLKDIAAVEMGVSEITSQVLMNGDQSVFLQISKQSGSNTVTVSELIHNAVNKLMEQNSDLEIAFLMDSADEINTSIGSVTSSLLIGAILAVIILYLFLREIRTTFIIAASIPLSVVATFVMMYFSGITLNMIALGGLALGVGMLVDNSIVVLENIFRYGGMGYSKKEAALLGTKEVAVAITGSTLTTVCVFLPIAFIRDNMIISMFKDAALTVTYSLMSSLLVAITLVPCMAGWLLHVKEKDENAPKSKIRRILAAPFNAFEKGFNKLEQAYKKALIWSVGHRKTIIFSGSLLFIGAVALMTIGKGVELFPSSDMGECTINVELPRGGALSETVDMMAIVDDRISELAQEEGLTIESVRVISGSVNIIGSGGSTHMGSMDLDFGSRTERELTIYQIVDKIRTKLSTVPGMKYNVSVSGGMMGGGSVGSSSSISVEINGDDLDVLRELSVQVAEGIRQIPGTREVEGSAEQSVNEVRIQVDRNKAVFYGMSAASIASNVQAAIRGNTATKYKVAGNEIDVIIRMDNGGDIFVNDVNNLQIPTAAGDQVPLYEVAEIIKEEAPESINRKNQVRTMSVTSALSGERSIGLVSADVENFLATLEIPEGYSAVAGGSIEDLNETVEGFMTIIILAMLLVYMVMASQFESLLHPFIIMFTVPLSVIGVSVLMTLANKAYGVTAFIGLVVLIGVVVNNAIVLIDYILILRGQGMSSKEAAISAGPVRLRPVLMTTLTTVLGLIPLALGLTEGSEMQQPMGITVIGGLSFSTLLTLIYIPVLYVIFDNIQQKIVDFFSGKRRPKVKKAKKVKKVRKAKETPEVKETPEGKKSEEKKSKEKRTVGKKPGIKLGFGLPKFRKNTSKKPGADKNKAVPQISEQRDAVTESTLEKNQPEKTRPKINTMLLFKTDREPRIKLDFRSINKKEGRGFAKSLKEKVSKLWKK